MKKKILILLSVMLASQAPLIAGAAPAPVTVLLAGGPEANMIYIGLSADGRSYLISSVVALEVGGTVCSHPPENQYELVCQASAIAGFEVNAGPGDDTVTVAGSVPVPVTLRGGSGADRLTGGGGADKLVGGAGDDRLYGRGGADVLYGGEGRDVLWGGSGNDVLWGGPGKDVLKGGHGTDELHQGSPTRHHGHGHPAWR